MKRPRAGGPVAALAAYGMWGLFPLYFHQLSSVPPVEVLSHRIVWSFVLMIGVLWMRRSAGGLSAVFRDRRRATAIVVAGLFLATNWLVYIAAVAANRVVDASLGYFINPLFTVLLGVVLLRESLRPAQWAAVGLGGFAVVVLIVGYGQVPWIALILAVSFGLYGYFKKYVRLETVESLTAETVPLVPAAAIFLVVQQIRGHAAFGHSSAKITILLALAGIVTALPLLAFGAATNSVDLSTLGLLQYITPVVQFVLALTVFHEHVSPARWVGFALVWAALVVLTIDSVRSMRGIRLSAARRSGAVDAR